MCDGDGGDLFWERQIHDSALSCILEGSGNLWLSLHTLPLFQCGEDFVSSQDVELMIIGDNMIKDYISEIYEFTL